MLRNDFFEVVQLDAAETSVCAKIKLNANHAIYQGHFPANPVTPGVVQLQIVKEILELAFSKKLSLESMGRCKFLKVLNPIDTPQVTITIDYKMVDDAYKINASGDAGDQTYFKFSAHYK